MVDTPLSPIFYILGVDGQFHLAKAMAKEFGRPVVGITVSARVDEALTPETRSAFAEIISWPDYYLGVRSEIERLPRTELDREQRERESRLGIADVNRDVIFRDRALRWRGDYMKVRVWHVAALRFLEDLMARHKPVFCIDGVAHHMQLILRAACRKKDVPYLLTQNSRLNGHFNILHENGHHVGFYETFDALRKQGEAAIDPDILKKADGLFEQFLQKPVRPAYADKNSVTGVDFRKFMAKLRFTLHPDRLAPSDKVLQTDRALHYESDPIVSLGRGMAGRWRRVEQRVWNVFDRTPDLSVPYIYLPLHYTPEISDMYFGWVYDHHAGFVTGMARHLPGDLQLYVKEHTSMIGRRPTAFYRELKSLYNVRMVDPSVNTFELARNARAVATITGTAGWEAWLMGKPVIGLGDVFYNRLPGVLHAPMDAGCGSRLLNWLENFAPVSEEVRRDGYRAFCATSCPGTKGDIGTDISRDQAEANAALFVHGLRKKIEKWGHTMGGSFSALYLSP